MKKLLYIQDSFGSGGINVVESIKENYLSQHGYEVANLNVLNDRKFNGSYRYDDIIKKYYIENDVLERFYNIPIIGRLLRFFYFRLKLLFLILKINPEIIIASRDELEPFSVVLLTFWKKRILEFHCGFLDKGITDYPLKKKLRCKIKYRFYHLVSLTKQDQVTRSSILKQKVTVIPNATDLIPTKFSTQTENRILIVARFEPQKNLIELLKSWEGVQKKHPNWSLDIFGEGSQKVQMLNIIKDHHLSSVCVKGYIKNPIDIIPDYSFFLLPSIFEGFGMTLIEAMICGVPCIAYDCPCGPAEIITDGVDGIVVPLGDMNQFVEKVNYLIENKDVRESMSMRCRENIKRYNLDVIMKMWMDLFESM